MSQLGTVESIEKDRVFVKVIREEACAHCQVCTTGINEGKECLIEVVNQCGAGVGDVVDIDIQTNYFLQATAIMYGIPLIAMVLGIVVSLGITSKLGLPNAEVISAVIGIILTGTVYLLINLREKKNKNIAYLPIAISKQTAEL